MSKLQKKNELEKLNIVINNQLPSFANVYFKANLNTMTIGSLYVYALDLSLFFKFMEELYSIPVRNFIIKDFGSISDADLENYFDYATHLSSRDKNVNESSIYTVRRKYASLSSFYTFFFREGLIDKNPVQRFKAPKLTVKAPKRPTLDEINGFVEFVEKGELQGRSAIYQKNFRERDVAIITLLVDSGLKASEIIKLNISDIYLDKSYIDVVSRRYHHVAISKCVVQKLSIYLSKRLEIIPLYGHEEALFLSSQATRMAMRTMQVMIKKYTTALFGDEYTYAAKDFTAAYRNQLFNSLHSVSSTALLCGNSEETIYSLYRADLIDIQSTKKYTPINKGFYL